MKLALLCTLLTKENSMLLKAAEAKGIDIDVMPDSTLTPSLDVSDTSRPDAVLQRSSSFSRSLYTTKIFEDAGVPVVNSHAVQSVCGDKALTTLSLTRAGIATPKTKLAFTREGALEAIKEIGYPVVLKPVVGSWGRLLAKINDEDAARAVLEHKDRLGSYMHKVYYIQEYVEKPGRDIRAIAVGDEIVCAMYRHSNNGSWLTNVARGATGKPCPLTDELKEVCLKASAAVGGGVLGIDVMEGKQGLLVHEINHAVEFKGATEATGVDVAGKIIDYVAGIAK